MSKNAIIGIVVGVAVMLLLILVLVLPAPEAEEPLLEDLIAPEEPIVPDMPIMELTEEELLELQAIFGEAVPVETSIEDIEKLDAELMLLTADELRDLTVEKVQEMLAEIQG